MRVSALALASALIFAHAAMAQVGGNGVSRTAGGNNGVLGYNQTAVTHGLVQPSLCTGAPFTVNGQLRKYIVLYDSTGNPYWVPGC